jgi:hypothetical protein
MSASLDQRPDAHLLTLDDHRVTQLLVELRGVRLLTYSLGDAVELRVAVPFRLVQADGEERHIDPGEPERLAPLLTLVGRRAEVMRMADDGGLTAGFSDGTVLQVDPHVREAAWQLQGAGGLEGLAYACPAGGGPPWGPPWGRPPRARP